LPCNERKAMHVHGLRAGEPEEARLDKPLTLMAPVIETRTSTFLKRWPECVPRRLMRLPGFAQSCFVKRRAVHAARAADRDGTAASPPSGDAACSRSKDAISMRIPASGLLVSLAQAAATRSS